MKTTVHIISHSHWDREWYQSFEKHRMKLIELVDNILEKAENDPEFGGFFLDGQTIALDDYLEVRPEKREQVKKCVREGKIQTGPWYILQDEFLTSGEACVRNLQVGMQEAARYGAIGNVGYFPDAFGNAGQMPQVLKQAGMDAVVFGRGVKPIGPNNEVTGGQYESTYSEMMWHPRTERNCRVFCLQTGITTEWRFRWMRQKQKFTGTKNWPMREDLRQHISF